MAWFKCIMFVVLLKFLVLLWRYNYKIPVLGMSHLALRKTKRGKFSSGTESKSGSEFLEVLKIIIALLITCYTWIRLCFVNIYHVNYFQRVVAVEAEISDQTVVTEEEETVQEQIGNYVVAKGVGLMSGYTGRRSVFAVYPACRQGLIVKSKGPASLNFEFRQRPGLLLISYIPPAPGVYRLRISRFGRRAVGSPFIVRIEDPPPGYSGHFGASLWSDEKPRSDPQLFGIVDFVTEKMYLTHDGRLIKLKNGNTQPSQKHKQKELKYKISSSTLKTNNASILQKNDLKDSIKILETSEKEATVNSIYKDSLESRGIPGTKIGEKCFIETPEKQSMQGTPEFGCENVLELRGIQNYKIGIIESKIDKNDIVESTANEIPTENKEDDARMENRFQERTSAKKQVLLRIEKLLSVINKDKMKKDPMERYQFVSKALIKELSLSLKLLEMLGSAEECLDLPEAKSTDERQTRRGFVIPEIRIRDEKSDEAEGPHDGIGSNGRRRRTVDPGGEQRTGKWHWGDDAVSRRTGKMWKRITVSKLLGKREPETNYLHQVYKTQSQDSNPELNNSSKIPQPSNNRTPKITPNSSGSIKLQNNIKNIKTKLTTNGTNVKKLSDSVRTLSLPDFNRFNVKLLRKAKSCGDKAVSTLSSSNIFQKEQSGNVIEKTNTNSLKFRSNFVKPAQYRSEHEKEKVTVQKSVEDWTKYWEDAVTKDNEVNMKKECSEGLYGFVNRRKVFFESKVDPMLGNARFQQRSKSVDETIKSPGYFRRMNYLAFNNPEERFTSPSPVSNKTAFEKAKELFEGNYDLGFSSVRSVEERFQVTCLSDDLRSGVSPERMGVPNRASAVSCLGSVYQSQYPHMPISSRRRSNSEERTDFFLKMNSNFI